MATRTVSAIFVVLAISIAITLAGLAYFSTLQQSQTAQQPVQVVWRDAVGSQITSVSLGAGARSITVSFTCSQTIGQVALKVSSNIANTVKLTRYAFSSCSGAITYLTITISSTGSLNASGTVEVVRSDLYAALSSPLTINIHS